jgi:hypothetical protein
LAKLERTVVATAASRSASAKMTTGFFPPISSESFLNSGPAVRAISAPVRVLPVNETAFTSGWRDIASPTFGPRPWTMLSTPGGNPASSAMRPSQCAVTGVTSDGLATTVFPTASAGATFQVRR